MVVHNQDEKNGSRLAKGGRLPLGCGLVSASSEEVQVVQSLVNE